MCGTGTVGSGASMPMAAMAHSSSVAGASGGGDVAGATGGGDMSSIASLLAEIAKSIQALQQALAGSGALAGAMGGGHGDMAGCDMMGGGAGGDSAAVDGANDGADAIGDTVEGGGHAHAPGKVDQTDVAGDTGAGKDDAPGKDSEVAGDTGAGKGAPGKDSDVAGTGGSGDPTQKSVEQTASEQAKAAQAAADKKSVDAAAAVKDADAKVVTAKAGVTKAETDLATAEGNKTKADTALVDAGAALTAARNGHGEAIGNGSLTLEQIAKRHGTTLAKLKELNPSITILGSLPEGTKVKLPKGVGVAGKVAEAQTKLDAARTAANAAAKAVTDAIAALNAAREALRQAEAAAAAAKKAAEDAEKAAAEAKKAAEAAAAAEAKVAAEAKAAADKKAAEEATAAAGSTSAGGVGGDAPTTRDYVVKAGDSPFKIARQQNVDALEFAKANEAAFKKGVIHPGQVLKIPVGGKPFDAISAGAAFAQYWGTPVQRTTQTGSNTGSGSNGGTTTSTTSTSTTNNNPTTNADARQTLIDRRTALQAERTRYTQMLVVGGYVTSTAQREINRIDQELREIAAALNGRAA